MRIVAFSIFVSSVFFYCTDYTAKLIQVIQA
nr:MAG TPA: hypothetical protein [Caudoviricetes sp.]